MNDTLKNIGLGALFGVVFGAATYFYIKATVPEWIVSPEQIAACKAQGQQGCVDKATATITVMPIHNGDAVDAMLAAQLSGGIGGLAMILGLIQRGRRQQQAGLSKSDRS